jgi:circadian clock protein KaiC
MTMHRAKINRLLTGVPGLDEVLGGGLPEYSFNIIAGSPGAGKTTLAHQLMFSLATPERPAVYFTVLGEPPLKMMRYQQQFDFFDAEKINSTIRFINLAEEAASGDLRKVLARISETVREHEPALVFVDSFRSVIVASQGDGENPTNALQLFIQQLGVLMATWQATTFLIGEYFADSDQNPIFTVADGVIWMRQCAERNSVVRKMEITKMRAQATIPGLHTFRITGAGVQVFAVPSMMKRDDQISPRPLGNSRLSMGVAGLDEMMGGGLPQGYSLLVAGPSGSGKSILAGAFLVEGGRRGETGVIAAFEQRPHKSRGVEVSELIDSGRVGVIDTRTLNVSVDEISMLLMAEIQRLQATRVVIDSLSGFELALPPTFRADYRESLARMVSALATTGATVLMTSELEDRYDDLRFSPYGTAFLTDAIIVQRYIELRSELRRVMAVVKVRASAHSNDLRLFSINDKGISIGEKLTEFAGLLGGRPTLDRPSVARNGAEDDG